MISIRKYTKITYFLYILLNSVIIQLYPSARYLRYIFIPVFIFPIFTVFHGDIQRIKQTRNYLQLKYVLFIIFSLSLLSLFQMIEKNIYNISFITESLFVGLPMLCAWGCAINCTQDDLDWYINVLFYFSIFNFFIRWGSAITISNILSVSFLNSFSPFESELVNIFLPLQFYYLFIRKNIKKEILSFLFQLLSLKRIHFIFSILFLLIFLIMKLYPSFKKCFFYHKYSKKAELLIIISVISMTLLLRIMLDGTWLNSLTVKHLGLSLDAFTFGRENIYKIVFNSSDSFAGWGSTRHFLKTNYRIQDMHSDLLRIYVETGLLGLSSFVTCYIKLFNRYTFALFFMMFTIVVMLMSPILTDVYAYTCIYFVLFSCILKASINDEDSKNL